MFFDKINFVFKKTQNSYKFYWWLAIVEIYFEKQKTEIFFDEIVLKIISKLWYPVNYFKLSFGQIDQCSKYIKKVKETFSLEDNIKEKDLYQFLIKYKNTLLLQKITQELTRYVPYRFIRPWYSEKMRGLDDGKVNQTILLLQNHSAPYKINLESKTISLNKDWTKFIKSHYALIKSFTLFELIKYLEKENPNTPNLSRKLEKPTSRSLNTQKKYWKKFILVKPNKLDVFKKPL